ncbi:MAG: energy-coupling factor ABC transporter ATP-binding protein [bacterium]|nr:energy-coupling factor ABC transporter ATP-binding protein [bacterium]
MSPAIKVDHLSFCYGKSIEALRDIDLQISEGETVIFIGPNGAGKSTLLLLLRGLLGALDGRIQIAGETLDHKKKVEALAGKVGLAFQNPDDQLFCTTVFDDVAFGPINMGLRQQEVKVRVEKALGAVGLTGYEARVPYHLSGGEKRRVSLATIYAMEPDILLLDEPTSHLDPRARQEVINLIHSFSGTKVIATHDFELILKVADRVVLFHQGRIRADGSPVQILTNGDLLHQNGMAMPLVIRYLMALHSGEHDALHAHEHEHVYHYHIGEGDEASRVIRHAHFHSHDDEKDHPHRHPRQSRDFSADE